MRITRFSLIVMALLAATTLPTSLMAATIAYGSVSDPVGDAVFATSALDGGGAPDIVFGSLTVSNGSLAISIRFAPGSFDPARMFAGALLDIDQNPNTGHPGVNAGGTLDAGVIGSEFIIYMGSAWFPQGQILQYAGPPINTFNVVGNAPFTFASDTLNATVPLSLLNNDEGLMNFKFNSGVRGTNITADVAPDIGSVGSTTPEPASAFLFSVALITGVLFRRRHQIQPRAADRQ